MRKLFFMLVLCLAGHMAVAAGPLDKKLFRIEHATPEILQTVQGEGADISRVMGLGSASSWRPRGMAEIELWLSPPEVARLRQLGLNPVPTVDESRLMWQRLQDLPERERDYHAYPSLTSLLQGYAEAFPNLCRVYSIGQSVQGRELWVVKISDNPDMDEDEPEVKYISTMHGNEPLGTEMLLFLLDDLLTEYGTDTRITNMVNNMEIHLLPLMNPDGNSAGTRTNANGVDLNRNFPDPYTSPNNTGVGRQPETAAVMAWTQGKDFDLSANFHTGALLVNYPFDNNPGGNSVYTASPDDDLFIQTSLAYSSTNLPMYNGDFTNGITNGADWYAMSGGMQDWNYRYEGGMEVTVELSDTFWPDASELPAYWDDNRESLLSYLEWSLRGVRGLVTSAATGLPLTGVAVRVIGRDYTTWSASGAGDYHRLLPAGTYSLSFSKPGYVTQTQTNVVVGTGVATVLPIALQPEVAAPDFTLGTIAVMDEENGRLDPGETALLEVELHNSGTIHATDLLASLYSGSPWVVVTGGPISLGTLAPEQVATASFQVVVSDQAPVGEALAFQLEAASAELSELLPFSLGVGLTVEDFESGTLVAWPWEPSGAAAWTVAGNAWEGQWCARSGSIGNNQTSRMALTQTFLAAGTATFQARISTEDNYDFLKVYLDGIAQQSLSGVIAWSEYSVAIPAGTHTLMFSYEKDGSMAEGEDAVYVDMLVLPPVAPTPRPDWTVTPPEVAATLAPGESTTRTVTIQNAGQAECLWTASLALDDPARTLWREEPKLAKGEEDPRPGQAARNAGGPDAFGYTWMDSREAGGPTYNWVEINSLGTALPAADDANTGPYALGFNFPYYGNTYSSVRICTNGFISFTATESAYNNAQIPAAGAPNNILAPFWDDLNPVNGGTIYFWDDPAADRFIVEYRQVRHYNGTTTETFQLILTGDGVITFQYQAVGTANSCSVGLENATGTDGLGLNYNLAGFLAANLAVRFTPPTLTPPWAVLTPLAGVTPAGASSDLSLALSAEDLADGVYSGTILLTSNDPDTPTVNVPLLLSVSSQLDPVGDLSISCGAGSIDLAWSAVPGATAYRVWQASSPAGPWTPVATTASPSWSGVLGADLTRLYRVTAQR
jgi:hypothetical protein